MKIFSVFFLCFLWFSCAYSETKKYVSREMFQHLDGWRHIEYCEILSSRNRMGWSHLLDFTAYNTIRLGCDRTKWKGVTADVVKKYDGGLLVRLNGPRGWAFDDVSSESELVDASISVINGIDMVVVGIVEVTLTEVLMNLFFEQTSLYRERQVRRKTEYIFREGKPLHFLQSPTNQTYAMQSYAKFKHPLDEHSLPNIGPMLHLPSGWSYHTVVLAEELRVKAENAIGVIVQDDFHNVYSRFNPNLLKVQSIMTTTTPERLTQFTVDTDSGKASNKDTLKSSEL